MSLQISKINSDKVLVTVERKCELLELCLSFPSLSPVCETFAALMGHTCCTTLTSCLTQKTWLGLVSSTLQGTEIIFFGSARGGGGLSEETQGWGVKKVGHCLSLAA